MNKKNVVLITNLLVDTSMNFKINTNLVDILNRKISPVEIKVKNSKIASIMPLEEENLKLDNYALPGFIDAHVHIESSMLTPVAFAQKAVTHGTIGTVSDPHEIANVLGIKGVEYMLENAQHTPFHFNFGAPSCVPATSFETAGATIDPNGIEELLKRKDIKYLAEMMNYPGVIHSDPMVLSKIELAKKHNKPIDGHAPGLSGEDCDTYINAGISTDHECFTLDEALYKLKKGMKILIREGSAAKNFGALHPLLKDHADNLMFCSDDKHPDDLMIGHINLLVTRALKLGYDLFDVLKVACINPINHYNLDIGQLRVGDPADFILVDSLETFGIKKNYIHGEVVFDGDQDHLKWFEPPIINQFVCDPVSPKDFDLNIEASTIPVIHAIDGELITKRIDFSLEGKAHPFIGDISADILKIIVLNRYEKAPPAIAFIHGFGLKKGAIASSVAHDSHNIVAVGTDHFSLAKAVNDLISNKGGISVFDGEEMISMALPIAGLISKEDCATTAKKYERLDSKAKALGSTLSAPFMTLSFMALLVIPSLKLSDKGLFDGKKFEFIK